MATWKDIPGFERLYQASDEGDIRTAFGKTTKSARFPVRVWKQRVMKPKISTNKYGRKDKRVELWKNGAHKTFLVARLVALAFCDGYEDGKTVNHIDGNPLNNRAENLEWVTRKENIQKAFERGLYHSKKRVCLEELGGGIIEFSSMRECDRFLGRRDGYTSAQHCQGKEFVFDSLGGIYVMKEA